MWAEGIAQLFGFHLWKASYKKSKSGSSRCLHLYCERGCEYNRGKEIDFTKVIRKKTSTKKCGCTFAVRILRSTNDAYMLAGVDGCGFYNHRMEVFNDGHWRSSKLSPDDLELLRQLYVAKVKPAQIRKVIVDRHPERPPVNLKKIYNATASFRTEQRDGKNRAQEMFYWAKKMGYLVDHLVDCETNEITHVFLIDPTSAEMLRAYYFVILIDSTYNCNTYNMPLVEFVGVTPVGKLFSIGIVLMKDESAVSYQWALEFVKRVLGANLVPNAIVTDHERGLIKSIPIMFPNSKHLLCVWHITECIDVRLRKQKVVTKANPNGVDLTDAQHKIIMSRWHGVQKSYTVEGYEKRWKEFQYLYRYLPNFIWYLNNQWLIHEKKFMCCYTNDVCHLGNTSTSQAESAHSLLKEWLGKANVSVDTIFHRYNALLKGQHTEIHFHLQASLSKVRLNLYPEFYQLLRGLISMKAHDLMLSEHEKARVVDGKECCCVIVSTHGLLCACRLQMIEESGDLIQPFDIHIFWRTLAYKAPQVQQQYDSGDRSTTLEDDSGYSNIKEPAVVEAKRVGLKRPTQEKSHILNMYKDIMLRRIAQAVAQIRLQLTLMIVIIPVGNNIM